MFLHNCLTIRNIQLGRFGTKRALTWKFFVVAFTFYKWNNRKLLTIYKWGKVFRDFRWLLLEIRTYRLVLIKISLFIYICILVPIDIFVFQFFSNCKKTNGFRLFYRNSWNPYQKSIKLILPDVFLESVMCLSGEFLHGWVPYCFCPPEVKKWPAELVYKVTSLASTNNADLFPSQGRNIWNKYLIPALYQSPAFESRIHRR